MCQSGTCRKDLYAGQYYYCSSNPSFSKTTPGSIKACQTQCENEPGCSYFWFYSSNICNLYITHGGTCGITTANVSPSYFYRLDSGECCSAGRFYDSTAKSCLECPIGSFKDFEGDEECSSCDSFVEHSTTTIQGAGSQSSCVCKAGFYHLNSTKCLSCPVNSISAVGSNSIDDCLCAEGYYRSTTGNCVKCPGGTYKSEIGDSEALCLSCDDHLEHSFSFEGSISSDQCLCHKEINSTKHWVFSNETQPECVCEKGYYYSNDGCVQCGIGSFKDEIGNDNACSICPAIRPYSTTISEGSISLEDCICKEGYYIQNGTCTLCDSYMEHSTTLFQGATSTMECVCDIGYYLHESGSKCSSCDEGATTIQIGALNDGKCVCKAGYYNGTSNDPDDDSIVCTKCEIGSFKSSNENNLCTICKEGTTTEEEGSISESDCVTTSLCTSNQLQVGNQCIDNTTLMIGGGIAIFGFVLAFVIIGGLLLFIVVMLVFFAVFAKLRKKANRFDHIEGVDMILKEAELDQLDSSSTPKIKVKQSSYIIDFKEIKIIKKIGEGGSSSMVYLADWNGTQCAFKGFSEGSSLVGTNTNTFNEFEKEVEICVALNHPSILQFYGASITPKRIGLLIQYCCNGDVSSFIRNYKTSKKTSYPMKEKIRILKEVASGMEYLHSRKMVHRDLKPENVLLDENEKSKIMDFGLSKTMDTEKTMTRAIGTVYYMAPEVIEGKYSYPCDVYSWAIMAFCIITENFSPYGNNVSQPAIMGKVVVDKEFRPQIIREQFADCQKMISIIEKCWDYDTENRLTFSELKRILEKIQVEEKTQF